MKFMQDRCEICGEPIVVGSKIPDELKDEIYRPSPDEVGMTTIDFKTGEINRG